MSSQQFETLSASEIRDLYNAAQQFVKTHMRHSDSPNMALAPFDQRFVGRTHLTVPIHGANSLKQNRQLFEMLEDTFGVDVDGNPPYIYDEIQADGTGIVYKLNLPILFKRQEKRRTTQAFATTSSIPTLEWPLFLMVVEIGLTGLLYYRFAAGVAF